MILISYITFFLNINLFLINKLLFFSCHWIRMLSGFFCQRVQYLARKYNTNNILLFSASQLVIILKYFRKVFSRMNTWNWVRGNGRVEKRRNGICITGCPHSLRDRLFFNLSLLYTKRSTDFKILTFNIC